MYQDGWDCLHKMTDDLKITVEALKYYVPIFQKGDNALNQILYTDNLSPGDKNKLETIAKLRDLAVNKITELSRPLIIVEINKILSTSYLKNESGIFDLLYYAGINGLVKGLRKFDVNKINRSSTNYLFQWITTYAKRELLTQEAPFNIAPSRYGVYKKINAVRQKLSSLLEREVSNKEVYNFFQSGEADIKTLNGPLKKPKISKANRNITMEMIEEQEEFSQKYSYMFLLDPIDDYNMPHKDDNIFEESIFGVFTNLYNFTNEAVIVLKSYLKFDTDDSSTIRKARFNKVEKMWKKLLKDINGPFYQFLTELNTEGFIEFDIKRIIGEIENSTDEIKTTDYIQLFEGEEIVRV